MNRSCLLCGCLCLTGLHVSGRMICCGCEKAVVQRKANDLPMRSLLALYRDVPELAAQGGKDETAR